MTQAQLHAKLVKNGVVTFSRAYLSKLTKQGFIPYKEDGKRKSYDYKEVVKALKEYRTRPEKPHNAKGRSDLSSIPAPKEGQTPEEYEKEIADSIDKKPTLAEAKTFLTIYQGKISQQKFDVEAGKLVYRDEVEQKAFIVARTIRDQLLTLPERLAGELASMNDIIEVKELMYKEINEILTYLHEGEALYDHKSD